MIRSFWAIIVIGRFCGLMSQKRKMHNQEELLIEGVNMKTPKVALQVVVAVVCLCGVVVWLGSRTDAAEKVYEIRPEDTLGTYRSDSARIMDAYERLMDRYMSLVEGNLSHMGKDVGVVAKKLDSIERKIDKLGTRITRIEKALNIQPPKPQAKKTAEQKPGQ